MFSFIRKKSRNAESVGKNVVAVYTGPHHREEEKKQGIVCQTPEGCLGAICLKRIKLGIKVALEQDLPLIICGDGNEGRDVTQFVLLALEAGVGHVDAYIHEDGRNSGTTETDALGLAKLLRDRSEYQDVDFVMLVTDPGHGRRAKIMTKGTFTALMPRRKISVQRMLAKDGIQFTREMMQRERHGIRDFIAKRYKRQSRAYAVGKPGREGLLGGGEGFTPASELLAMLVPSGSSFHIQMQE